MDDYPVPSITQRFELEIKRSRFITTVAHIKTRTEARNLIGKIRSEFPTANHHCWAYIAGAPDDASQYNQSDDGEPRGTAGKPMLNVLIHSGLGNIVVVISRYFGGIKLGTGGLVRAYTKCVSEALKTIETRQWQITADLTISFAYTLQGKIDYYLEVENIGITNKTFDSEVCYSLQVAVSQLDSIKARLLELTQGQLGIH
jgi:uncharacterized YigZ family protein